MNRSMEQYDIWSKAELEDGDLTLELLKIQGNQKEIYERFYTDLSFGTAGLRGIIGVGTNRMNIYTVRRASQGLAQFVVGKSPCPSIAIAYDSRNKSSLFAKAAAEVFAANGIKTYIYSQLMPAPMLSYAVRNLGCQAGIVITASHNPAEYNGYKVYGHDGCQLSTDASEEVLREINSLDIFKDILHIPFEDAMAQDSISYIREEIIESYLNAVLSTSPSPGVCKGAGLKVVYTPLNGTGNIPVREILKRICVDDVVVVKEQELPDGNFPTCSYPNPEIKEALALGIKTAHQEGADLVIATDPDADRVGIAVLEGTEYHLLSGNDVGVLLLDYICKARTAQGTMPKNPLIVKSIVSTVMADTVAAHYGVEVINVLTGFKHIGGEIAKLEQSGCEDRFILGFEESYGYLNGTYVRDKDGVAGSMLIAEMAAYHKKSGKTLVAVLDELYEKFGYHCNVVENTGFSGSDGMLKMEAIMKTLCENLPQNVGEYKVVEVYNYITGQKITGNTAVSVDLPASNVIIMVLENGATVVVRPSGTEPKLKVYYMVKAKNKADCHELIAKISKQVNKILEA